MQPSVHAFLSRIVDYAGLFPPAKLPLDEALANFLRDARTSPHTWMLGRFVCPVARLTEIAKADELQITALAQQGASLTGFLPQLDADLKAIDTFRQRWGDNCVVDALELPLPKGIVIEQLIDVLAALPQMFASMKLTAYLEVPFTASWQWNVDALTARLQGSSIGMKLRCGGLASDAFPSNAQVAHFIIRCRDAGVPWKATAGLHHPRRHFDAALNLWHHGFLNVFGAAILSRTLPLTEADVVAILADRDGQHFRFDAAGFAWENWACSVAQIEEARANSATSFGSCSFTEPCDDLQAMGLLEN